MRVLVACEYSQVVCKAFRNRGHEAYSCDILPTEGNPEWHIRDDVLNHLGDGWELLIAHPPCTDLAVSGASHFPAKIADGRQRAAIEFFMEFTKTDIPRYAIENPVSIMSTEWRPPDQIIQPYDFGHPESKTTCLWLKNLPKLVSTNVLPQKMQWDNQTPSGQNKLSPSPARATIRSRTYPGIAAAMASQWGDFKPLQLEFFS